LFILVKTSNPSSKDIQDLFCVRMDNIPDTMIETESKSVKLKRNYIQMARLVQYWNKDLEKFSGCHNLGAVIGATFPQ